MPEGVAGGQEEHDGVQEHVACGARGDPGVGTVGARAGGDGSGGEGVGGPHLGGKPMVSRVGG